MQSMLCTCPQAKRPVHSRPSPLSLVASKFKQLLARFGSSLRNVALGKHCHHHCRCTVTCDLAFEEDLRCKRTVVAIYIYVLAMRKNHEVSMCGWLRLQYKRVLLTHPQLPYVTNFGAPILFSGIGFCMVSCSYIGYGIYYRPQCIIGH